MKAVNNYIIITKIKEELKTDYGFIIQDNKNEIRYLKGKVVNCGEKTECINQKTLYIMIDAQGTT